MVKSPKNKKKKRSRSTLPQVNAPTQRAPNAWTHRAPKLVTDAIAGVQRVMSSGTKAMRRGKNQDAGAPVQQGDASTIANVPSTGAPGNSNSAANTTQEHGVVDPDASLLSDLGWQAPCFGTDTSNQFAPVPSPGAASTQNTTPPGLSPSTLPRLNTPGVSGVTEVGTDLLDDQCVMTTASGASVVGTHIPAPSPR